MTTSKRLPYIFGIIILLLSIPLIAMQYSDEVDWSAMDFVIMGALLLGVGLMIDLILRKIRTRSARVYLIIGLIVLFLLVWVELAVGIFGTPFAGD